MTPEAIERAAVLLKALAGVIEIHSALNGDAKLLGIEGFDGDEDGGTFHGRALIDTATGFKVIKAVETIIRHELEALGVTLR